MFITKSRFLGIAWNKTIKHTLLVPSNRKFLVFTQTKSLKDQVYQIINGLLRLTLIVTVQCRRILVVI